MIVLVVEVLIFFKKLVEISGDYIYKVVVYEERVK